MIGTIPAVAHAARTNSISFAYLAATPRGRRSIGLRAARSERALASGLRRDRLTLLRAWRLPSWIALTPDKLSLADEAQLNTQLAVLLTRHVPLVEALEVVKTVVSKQTRPVVERLHELVGGGASFSDACAQVGVFDSVAVAVYQAAERTGDLGGASQRLAEASRRRLAVRGKAATLLAYPLVVMSISTCVIIALLTLVVPQIGEAMASLPGEIPWYTSVIVGTGVGMRDNWLVALSIAGGLLVLAILLRKPLLKFLAGTAHRLPVFKDVLLAQESARFFAVLAAMTSAGVPLTDGLGVAVQTVNIPRLRAQLNRLRTKLVEGGTFLHLIDHVTMLPIATRRLLIAAERAGDLDTAFASLSEDLANDVDTKTQRLLALLEPALIVGMFLIIGSIVLAILIPLLTLPNQVGL